MREKFLNIFKLQVGLVFEFHGLIDFKVVVMEFVVEAIQRFVIGLLIHLFDKSIEFFLRRASVDQHFDLTHSICHFFLRLAQILESSLVGGYLSHQVMFHVVKVFTC